NGDLLEIDEILYSARIRVRKCEVHTRQANMNSTMTEKQGSRGRALAGVPLPGNGEIRYCNEGNNMYLFPGNGEIRYCNEGNNMYLFPVKLYNGDVNTNDLTWNHMELSVMLEHVQAHVAPTDVDPGAGLQGLPNIHRSSPKRSRDQYCDFMLESALCKFKVKKVN
nr:protein SABRE isoform X1 [Tanacetum cinerariifolium]